MKDSQRSHRSLLLLGLLIALPTAIILALLSAPAEDEENAIGPFDAEPLKEVLAARKKLDESLWAPEQLALEHENTFVHLWDQLRLSDRCAEVVQDFPFDSITLGRPSHLSADEHGITTYSLKDRIDTMTSDAFRRQLGEWEAQGFQLQQSEWHHDKMERNTLGQYVSTIQVSLHVLAVGRRERIQIKGPLRVTWSGRKAGTFPIPGHLDARDLIAHVWSGQNVYRNEWNITLETIHSEAAYNDVLAADLNGDGFVDLAYPRANILLRNDGAHLQQERLFDAELKGICEGLFLDLNGDRMTDLVCAAVNDTGSQRDLFVYHGDEHGRFSTSPRQLTDRLPKMLSPDSITAGDIDADGDLDFFVTQYHAPYRDGKMPSPYYDANDGLPAFLLVNESGTLRDETVERGLGAKRHRRTYRSSLVDLDNDRDLDLLVTSDFSGIDIYVNDGQGSFQDVTGDWLEQRTLFGMSHVLADLNNDAQLDIYATGMSSTTARRLESLGLARSDFPENRRWRAQLGYGNRLYFGSDAGFVEQPQSKDVARAGWSWGCAALDIENDGDVDLYVANGHLSGKSAADYCTRFWCHDIYVQNNPARGFTDLIRANTLQLGTTVSWNGYEKNRLFLNRGPHGFAAAGYLMNVAVEQDSRSVLAEDLNNDGRVDLIVGCADRSTQPPQYVLRGFVNQQPTKHHWIGVRVADGFGYQSVGATVRVKTRDDTRIRAIITGESFAAQHSPTAHFGLGSIDRVEELEVRWAGGETTRLTQPTIDQYHVLRPPEKKPPAPEE